jgi:formylmethanofuran dehydrogenase subunit E
MVDRSGLAMKSKMTAEKVFRKELDYAVRLHGHLGPFLVIGVRMGKLANGMFRSNAEESKFQVTIKVPQTTPFTCIIDGIQSSTHCTIGNQRLAIRNSDNEISGSFGLRNSKRIITISLRQKVIKDLMDYFKDGAKSEEVARKVGSMSNDELFAIEVI